MKQKMEDINLDLLKPDPNNPRKHFPESSLQEMAVNLKAVGQIEPLVVRPLPGGIFFGIVCGERRYRGAIIAGIKTLLCQIRELTDDQVFDIQVSENLHREDVSPLDEADTFMMIHKKGQTIDDIAIRTGKSAEYILGRIKLTNLVKEGKEYLETDILPVTAAIKIATLSEKYQRESLKRIISEIEIDGAKKKIFTGLKDLKSFFENNILMPLDKADFDPLDKNLCPAAGSCGFCPKKTGPGLFNSLINSDKCLDSDCYKNKQVTHYQKLKDKLLKSIKEPIVFCARTYGGEQDFKALGEVLSIFEWSEATDSKSKKNLNYAIFVGGERTKMESVVVPQYGYVSVTKKAEVVVENISPLSKEAQLKEKQKIQRDELTKILYYKNLFTQFKKTGFKTITPLSAYNLLANLLDETNIQIGIMMDIVRRYDLVLPISIDNGKAWVEITLSKSFEDVIDDTAKFSTSFQECFDAVSELDTKKILALINELMFIGAMRNDEALNQYVVEFELDTKAAKKEAATEAKNLLKATE